MNINQYKNIHELLLSVSGKLPPGKFPPIKLPPGEFPHWKIPNQKIPTWNIPTHVFKYSHLVFFHYCRRYHWYYLKDYFIILCFKSAEVFTFVKICQNKVLSEERELMKWVGIFQERNFWVAIFRGGGKDFPGETSMGIP